MSVKEKISEAINRISYGAVGSDATLQKLISKFLISLMASETDVTPGQLGYLGCMPVCANGKAYIKLFFVPKLSATLSHNYALDKDEMIPNPELKCLQNWFFVGDLADVVTLERRTIRKYKMVDIEVEGHTFREIKFVTKEDDDGHRHYKMAENVPVMSIKCNLDLVVAAINDLDLNDPSFKVKFKQVVKKPKASEHVIVSTGTNMEFPIKIDVSYDGEYRGYDPDTAIPYLINKVKMAKIGYDNEKKLQKDADKRAKKVKRENKKHYDAGNFGRKYGK